MMAPPLFDESPTGSTLLGVLDDPANNEGWQRFDNRYRPPIVAWLQARRCIAPEDVAQEVFKNLWRAFQRDRYRRDRPFRPWLKQIVRHAWLDFEKSRRRHPELPGQEEIMQAIVDSNDPAGEFWAAIELVHRRELWMLAETAVQATVAEGSWSIYLAINHQQQAPAQVAERLAKSLATIYQANHRTLEKVKDEFQDRLRRYERDEA
ncbi:MAG: RNA polymerase sigma factor [Pirellulales bacterium]